jgi:Xaa-Pro aminopeptidase
MRKRWVLAAFFAAGGVLWPATGEYPARRAALSASLKDGAVVLFSRAATEYSGDHRTGFRQDPNFFYLSGWEEPGAVMLIAPGTDILFLPRPEARRETYTGKMLDPAGAAAPAATGFQTVLPVERFEAELSRVLDAHPRIYTIGEQATARLRQAWPMRDIAGAADAIMRMRMVKSPEELTLIRRAAEASMEAHRTAWKRAAPGMYEYQVAAAMVQAFADMGCERAAYAPIVASGPNAVVLHYWKNRRRMERGELVLMDVGAECSGYVADITRTIPLGAKFTARQREIYDVVLGAQKAAIAAVKPGVILEDLTKIAREYMDTRGGLGKYLSHRISHHVGLDVHDPADLSAPLAQNMVITVEPGIYIPEENLGIRIEEMVLVTKDGAEVLTAALPREPDDIEKALGK